MRWNHYVSYFWGGAFLANAVPHFVSGVTGHSFQSPFASPPGEGLSSATVNVLWGSFNLAIGYLLLCRVGTFELRRTKPVVVSGLGALLMSLMLAHAFGRFYGPWAGDKSMMTLTSPSFASNAPIPKIHTGDGKDVSPALSWTNAPSGTKSFALIMDDPDAPSGTWVHWVLYDLPARETELKQGVPKTENGPGGSKLGACWGVDTFERVGYYGPQPPPGKPHHYVFKLYAVDKILGLEPRATKAQVLKAMSGHALAEAELVGTYQR